MGQLPKVADRRAGDSQLGHISGAGDDPQILGIDPEQALVVRSVVVQAKDETIPSVVRSPVLDRSQVRCVKQVRVSDRADRTSRPVTCCNVEAKPRLVRPYLRIRKSEAPLVM